MISPAILEHYNLIPSDKENEFFVKKGSAVTARQITLLTGVPVILRELDQDESTKVEAKPANQPQMQTKTIVKLSGKTSAITAFDTVFSDAAESRASDIHVESIEKGLKIRFRIDGHLLEAYDAPAELKDSFIARIKILSNLDVAEKRRPQDGRIRYKLSGKELDLRVSVVPVHHGEKIVIRLLDSAKDGLNFKSLGFDKESGYILEKNLAHSNGLILVTGPTGSGKSTTLYTALTFLNKPQNNILTIEDPIEYHIQGVNQSAVKEDIGYTFAQALRAFLRQDPNIIMVGEIRDLETAEIAIRASLTGHLVLSTLHTNDAQTTPFRLMDMGVEPFLLAATLRLVTSQRLVRLLCPHCKTPVSAESLSNDTYFLESKHMLGHPSGWKLFKPTGCASCKFTGYKGRTVIYQMMEVNQEIRDIITHSKSLGDMNTYLESVQAKNLFISGMEKVVQGLTTIDEVVKEAL